MPAAILLQQWIKYTSFHVMKTSRVRETTFSLSSPYLCVGTFYVDPHIPLLDKSRRKCKRKSQQQLPHASFRTRTGDISIDLGTTGDAHDTKKAIIDVATLKGDIKINLVCTRSSSAMSSMLNNTKLPTLPIRPLGLDVTSRKGKSRGKRKF